MSIFSKRLDLQIRRQIGLGLLLGIILFLSSGYAYRVVANMLDRYTENPTKLPVPLSDFPMMHNQWMGKEIPIPENIQRVARNDDFLSRTYKHAKTGHPVYLYIAFTAQPRYMLGHNPQECYTGGGFNHLNTSHTDFTTKGGQYIPCLLHYFQQPSPRVDQIVVLNYYILNGAIVNNEKGFSGLNFRAPNISGEIAHYVAQVQIRADYESAARKAAIDFTDLILQYFPDKQGHVEAQPKEIIYDTDD